MNTGVLNEHFKWGWGDSWYTLPTNANEKFKVSLVSAGTCGSFHDETVKAAILLAAMSTKPLLVCLSAGLDSQVISLALKEAKIPFTALTLCCLNRHGGIINHDDVEFSKQFCKLHNIQQEIVSFDFEEFLGGWGSTVAEECAVMYYRTLTVAYCAKYGKDTHTVISGDGNVTFALTETGLGVCAQTSNNQSYFMQNNIEGTAHFFKYTPELTLSQIDNPIVLPYLDAYQSLYSAFTENSSTPHLTWRMFGSYVKPLLYQANWDGLIHRAKQHGFEKFDDSYWKPRIDALGMKRLWSSQDLIIPAKELLAFLKQPKGTTKIWVMD